MRNMGTWMVDQTAKPESFVRAQCKKLAPWLLTQFWARSFSVLRLVCVLQGKTSPTDPVALLGWPGRPQTSVWVLSL